MVGRMYHVLKRFRAFQRTLIVVFEKRSLIVNEGFGLIHAAFYGASGRYGEG